MKYLLLILGESGSGKSTIVKELCKRNGYKELVSYTDRPKRSEDEDTHIFLTKEEADKMCLEEKIAAYTVFDGHQYFCTEKQIDESDIYVIDPAGLDNLKKLYAGDKHMYSLYIFATEEERMQRMLDRGQTQEEAAQRIEHDRYAFDGVKKKVDLAVRNKKLKRAVKKVERLIKEFEQDEKIIDWIEKLVKQYGNKV